MNRLVSLLLVGGSIWIGGFNSSVSATGPANFILPKPTPVNKAIIVETSVDKCIHVKQKKVKGRQYETIIIKSGRRVYRVPDERVWDLDQYGNRFFYNEKDDNRPEDNDTRIDHEFFLSPKADWLFVTRKLFHPVNVGYLYHLSGKRPVQIRPRGLRFDDAAIGFFARRLHFPFPTIGAGARVIHFERWTSNRLIFRFGANQRYDRKGQDYDISGYYMLDSGRFGLISESKT